MRSSDVHKRSQSGQVPMLPKNSISCHFRALGDSVLNKTLLLA